MAVKPDPEKILEAAHRCSVIGREIETTIAIYAQGRGVPEEITEKYIAIIHPPIANLIHGMCMATTHQMLATIGLEEVKPSPDTLKSN